MLAGSKPLRTLDLKEPINFFRTNNENNFLAVAMEDFTIKIIDITSYKTCKGPIRELDSHAGQLTDIAFSRDNYWLISSSMDASIKIWDIPSGNLIDQFKTNSPCVSLDISPDGVTLATSHSEYLGVFLWSRREFNMRAIDVTQQPRLVSLPECAQEIEEEETGNEEDDVVTEREQIGDLITMSGLPTSLWLNLLDIEQIKERNKLKQPKKKMKPAPFFLPTVQSLDFQFDVSKKEENKPQSKIISAKNFKNYTVFGNLLHDSIESNDFSKVLEKIKSFGPSAVVFEINSLDSSVGGSVDIMLQFMKFLNWMFETRTNYDIASAYYGMFMKCHANTIASEEVLAEYFKIVSEKQEKLYEEMNLLSSAVSVLKMLPSMLK